MTDNATGTDAAGEITGQMFLYEKPELLAPETHGAYGFTPTDRPYDHVSKVRAIPLTTIEFGSAQRNFPIIFSSVENPVPLAVVAILDDTNLFVDEAGQWDPMAYVPAYLKCYPFAFAAEESGRMAVVVDMAAANVSEDPQYPFFVDGKLSEHADAMMRLVAQYEGERNRTKEFCDTLVELELLTSLRATHTPEGASEPEPIADYISIDTEKLTALPADTVYELHKKGFLSAMYLQLYSLENWRHLMARRVQSQPKAA
ncbi:MAG: SapC family protein [Woeseiaceae bacterium]|nr:SapC family protein [Woeseiaceae bacterium]